MPRAPEVAFLLEAGELKRVQRRGWKRVGVRAPESVADHSWRLALMAMLYADLEGLDAGRAARIALLHDLPEVRAGDAMPGEWTPAQKHAREARALRAMLKPLPPLLREEYEALWNEYEEGASPEARLVAELDKLEMAAQALRYEDARVSPRKLDGFWASAEAVVRAPRLRAALDAMRRQRRG